MSQKRKRKTTRIRQKSQEKPEAQSAASVAHFGEFWIDPDLNRRVAGPGGNRGDHTTSAAKLLKLADIALKKGA
jgi:hypothetical protein